jgi:hypothetical protein
VCTVDHLHAPGSVLLASVARVDTTAGGTVKSVSRV